MQNGRELNAEEREKNVRLVVDDTTIYEVDLDCCQCMTEQERQEAGVFIN